MRAPPDQRGQSQITGRAEESVCWTLIHIWELLPFNPEHPASLLAQVRYRSGDAFDLIVFAANIAGLGSDENANPGGPSAGFPNLILAQDDRFGFAIDLDANSFFPAAIDDAVSLDAIPVRGECLVPATKVDAGLAASPDVIVADEIVGIAVTEGHSIAAVLDHVLLIEPMLRAPAKVDAFGRTLHPVAANNGTLRARPGVHRQ